LSKVAKKVTASERSASRIYRKQELYGAESKDPGDTYSCPCCSRPFRPTKPENRINLIFLRLGSASKAINYLPWSKSQLLRWRAPGRRLKNSLGHNYDGDLCLTRPPIYLTTTADLFLSASVKHLQLSEDRYQSLSLSQLSDEQMWYRGADHENSIANLLLHLEGNMRQWFLHGIDGQPGRASTG